MPTQDTRNYNTISPSARSLLLLKGHTPIPYAREAAALIQYPEPYEPDFSNRQPGFWIRDPELQQGDTLKEFFKQHRVQENMFESWFKRTPHVSKPYTPSAGSRATHLLPAPCHSGTQFAYPPYQNHPYVQKLPKDYPPQPLQEKKL